MQTMMDANGASEATGTRLTSLLGVLARAGAMGRGQPEGHVERICYLGLRIADQLKLSDAERADVYFSTLLVHAGCTAGNAELAAFFAADELVAQRELCLCDPTNLVECLAWLRRNVAPTAALPTRAQRMLQMMFQGERIIGGVERGCSDVAARIAARLGMPATTSGALRTVCETWNGKGPAGLRRGAIPLAARITHVAMVVEVFARERDRDEALAALGRRAGKSLDPELVQAVTVAGRAPAFWTALADPELPRRILDEEPGGPRFVDEAGLDDACLAFADFVDLKGAGRGVHARATAELAERAARAMGWSDADVTRVRRAALVHDLGQVGVPSFVLSKAEPGPAERAQIALHPLLTERLLAPVAALRDVAAIAAAHEERLDGSGLPNGLAGDAISPAARLLAVVDEFHELLSGGRGRPALSADAASSELEAGAGVRFDRACVRALAGLLGEPPPARARASWPAGLTEREGQVLRLAARGLTLKEIARDLGVSVHTARHHLEHVYEKIGVSSRAGAALFAAEHDLLP
jgi:HD-GYP domain-containing protein (c-di-GMP phosphodiesterase class II)